MNKPIRSLDFSFSASKPASDSTESNNESEFLMSFSSSRFEEARNARQMREQDVLSKMYKNMYL
jgi:hypothetical protein